MNRWLSQGLSSLSQLKEQASEFAQEVLSETRTEVDDPVANLAAAKNRVAELESLVSSYSNEITALRESNQHLHERASTAEYQLLQIETRKHEDLSKVSHRKSSSEGWTINLDSPPIAAPIPTSRSHEFGGPDSSDLPLSPTSFEFEVRKLKDEVKQLQAECLHWKQLVKQQEKYGDADPAEQISKLVKEVETLKHKLTLIYEEHQSELLALQEEHQIQLSNVRSAAMTSSNSEEQQSGVKRNSKGGGWDNDWDDGWAEEGAATTQQETDRSEIVRKLEEENRQLKTKLTELDEHRHPEDQETVIDSLKEEKAALEQSLVDLDQEHQIVMGQILQTKSTLMKECQELQKEVETYKTSTTQKDTQIQQLENETKELSDAYNDLNEQYEKQKQESGNVVSNNRELVNRLDALKGDLVEYEEKYERCKIENEKAVHQLEILTLEFDKLKQDLAHNRSTDEQRKWQEQVLKLSNELEDSLKKREELINNVGKFQEVVENFEEKVNKFRDDNQRLRDENADLTETLASLSEMKETFSSTDDELTEIRRSLKEYQLVYMKKELVWRQQIETLTDENETLKEKISSLSEHEERVNGHLVKLSETNGNNSETSYVHIELVPEGEEATTVQKKVSDESQKEIDELNKAVNDRNIELDQLKTDYQNLMQQCNTREVTNQKIAEEIEQLRQHSAQMEEACIKEIDKAQERETALQERLKELEHQLSVQFEITQHGSKQTSDQVSDLKSQLEIMMQQRDAALFQLADVQRELENSQKGLNHLQNVLQQFQQEEESKIFTEVEKYKREMDLVRQEKANVEKTVNELVKQFNESRKEIETLNNAVNDKNMELEQLKANYWNISEQLKTREGNSQKSEKETEQLRQHLVQVEEAYRNEAVKSEERETILRKRLTEVEDQLRVQLESSQDGNKQMSEQLGDLKIQLEATTGQRDAALLQLANLQLELEKSQKELNHWQNLFQHFQQEQESKIVAEVGKYKHEIDLVRQEKANVEKTVNEFVKQFNESRKEIETLNKVVNDKNVELDQLKANYWNLAEQFKTREDSSQKSGKETERLRQHLVQIEEAYTNEAVKAEERETMLRKRLKELEDQLRVQLESSQDGNKQMIDQLGDLKIQLEAMADQRDAALLQLADVQLELEKSQKGLNNLQNVLQHFQQERDSRVFGEVEKYRHEIELVRQEKLNIEKIVHELQKQLNDNQLTLKATSVISDQIAEKEKIVRELKKQLLEADDKCVKLHSQLIDAQKIRDGKIDKEVLKNLLLGYFCSPANKKPEVAHLLGSVLGFTPEEFKKSESATGGGGGWLQFLRLGSSAGGPHSTTEQSLAGQFIKFLENESVPKTAPTPVPMFDPSSNVSRSSTPATTAGSFRLELPSFSGADLKLIDESTRRSSSDFLRDVLKPSEDL